MDKLSQRNRVIQFLYWCRILDNGWCRTVLHDKRQWIIFTIYRISGLSWVHFVKRWTIFWAEVTTSYLRRKFGVVIRIESVNKDNCQSWVRVSHGLNKLVTDLSNNVNDNEQEISEMRFEDFAFKTNVFDCKSRSKAKVKPRRRPAHLQELHISERFWTVIETEIIRRLPNVKTTEYSSSTRSSTSRRRWSDWNLEMKRLSSEPFCAFSTLVWCNVEECNGKRRRKQEKISVLCWCIRRNSLLLSCSRSFRMQSLQHKVNSEQFLRIQLSCRLCDQFTLHKFRMYTRRTFEQKTDGILYVCGTSEQRTQRSEQNWFGSTASCMVPSESERNTKTRCNWPTWNFLKRKDLSSMKHDRTQSFFTTHFQFIVSWRQPWWELEKSFTSKDLRHFDFLRRFLVQTFGWKNWAQKLLELVKIPNKPKQKSKTRFVNTERFVNSCVPVSVECLDQDKDADENVDADHVRTVGLVKSGQSIGSFTQREEIDIDFRVSALPYAVVKQAGNFVFAFSWRRLRVIFVEKHFKPICSRITSTTHSVKNQRWWFVKCAMWSCSIYAIQIHKCANFCLRCDTIDDSGVLTQRHDDEDKCAKWFETWDGTWDVDRLCSWEVRTTMNNLETVENKTCMCIVLYFWQAHHSVYTQLDQLACFTQAHPRNTLISSK